MPNIVESLFQNFVFFEPHPVQTFHEKTVLDNRWSHFQALFTVGFVQQYRSSTKAIYIYNLKFFLHPGI